MTGFLLDTNVISELTRDDPDSRVVRFLDDQGDLWLSSVVVYEMEYGLATLPQGRRLARLRALHADILAAFDNRVLSLDQSGAPLGSRTPGTGPPRRSNRRRRRRPHRRHRQSPRLRHRHPQRPGLPGDGPPHRQPLELPLAAFATPHQPRTTPTPAILLCGPGLRCGPGCAQPGTRDRRNHAPAVPHAPALSHPVDRRSACPELAECACVEPHAPSTQRPQRSPRSVSLTALPSQATRLTLPALSRAARDGRSLGARSCTPHPA